MSYFDDASLVMIPSGYKTSKVYSVKPTDGSGDLTFSRSNDTATRVNSAGLIEKVRTNLVLQSQTLDNATWSKLGSTITANATAAPDGTTTADSNIESAALDEHGVSQALSISAGLNTISVSVKANGRTRCRIGFANSNYGGMTPDQRFAYFDVSTGTIVQNISGGSSTIVSEGNGWYRCSVSQNLVAGDASGAVQLLFIDSGVTTFYTGDGTSGLFLWGAQLETGDIATDYIATTSAAVSVGPVANVPRLDYLNSSCPRLLLEPQRTNSLTYSEQFNNAAWTTNNSTISANVTATLDPSGYNGADKLQETTANADHNVGSETITALSAQVVTFSVFLKAAERTWAAIRLYDGNGSKFAYFNLSTGIVGSVTAGATSAISSYGNGWYRCAITTTMGSNTVTLPFVSTATADGVRSFAGTTGSGIYVWGAQQEIGAYATSYIPTLGAAVTRGADAASKTGISSLIGQTEGTLFLEININKRVDLGGLGPNGIEISNGSTSGIYLGTAYSSIQMFGVFRNNAGSFSSLITTTNNALGTYKLAAAYSSAGFVFYVNGVQIGTSATLPPAVTYSFFGLMTFATNTTAQGELVEQALLFKTRLTNAQLAELTTL